MIILLTRDGDNKNVILAVGLSPREDKVNYNWFIENCKACDIKFDWIPLFCDRGVALLSTAAVHLDMSMVHCTRHIVGNMKKKFKGTFTSLVESMVYNIQAGATSSEYESEMGILKLHNQETWGYGADIEPAAWCVFPNIDGQPLYGWRSTNFVESEDSSAVQSQFLPPLQFFQPTLTR